jgi:hypothetical protein
MAKQGCVMSVWNHSLCEDCWDARHSQVSPVRLAPPDREPCCICQREHASGIYLELDPTLLPCRGERGIHETEVGSEAEAE